LILDVVNETPRRKSPPLSVKTGLCRLSHPYWINAARNVARNAVSTRFIFASDVELYPSPKLAENFKRFIDTPAATNSTKTVYVVPAFEVDVSVRDRLPKSHRDLIELYKTDKSVYFHAKTCKQCQKFPRLKNWIDNKIEPGKQNCETGFCAPRWTLAIRIEKYLVLKVFQVERLHAH